MLPATANDSKPVFTVFPEAICQCFSLDDIHLATQNFNDDLVIGRGGFGTVYKGDINHGSAAATVAIKRMNSDSDQGAPEFRTEVEMLSRIRHSHLVSLIGYCKQGKEMVLVYEYMPQGTLEDHLYKAGARLSWVQLLRICIGAARGLDYLHTGTGTQHGIIHRDVKSSNILLDEKFAAKIADFGLAKICPTNQSRAHVSTLVKGTFGYLDPCYYNTGKLTIKSDVYAFGVLLLEVICGRPAVDTNLNENQWSLAQWAQDCVKQGKLNHIIDCNLRGQISSQCQKDFVRIARRCIHNQPNQRPTMAEIVSTLEAILSLQERLHSSLAEGNIIDKVLSFITPKAELKTDNFISVHPLGREGETSYKAGKASIPQSPPFVKNQTKSFQPVYLKSFSFQVIKVATRNFRPPAVVGKQVYSSLHKGWVDEKYEPARPGTGIPIAVKRLKDSPQGHQEWLNEITYLGSLDHPNIVNLIGYCLEEDHRMLVCEFMSGGNLGRHLFRKTSHSRPLSWNLRIKIALGVARGLAYFHSPEAKDIYHDFKSCSILLDTDYNAKLCLLWLAKDGPVDGNSRASSRVMGTNGYTAPNSNATGDLVTNDIYAYGVVLLEILTGRRCIDKQLPPSEQILVEFVKSYQKNKRRILEILDPQIDGQYSSTVGAKAAKLAMKCVLEEPKHRPTAYQVVKVLEELQESQISVENSVRMSCIN